MWTTIYTPNNITLTVIQLQLKKSNNIYKFLYNTIMKSYETKIITNLNGDRGLQNVYNVLKTDFHPFRVLEV